MRDILEKEIPDDFALPLLMEVLKLNGEAIGDRYCRFGEILSFSKNKVRFNHPKLMQKNDEVTVFIKDPKTEEFNELIAKLKITAIKAKEFLSNEYLCEIKKLILNDIAGGN